MKHTRSAARTCCAKTSSREAGGLALERAEIGTANTSRRSPVIALTRQEHGANDTPSVAQSNLRNYYKLSNK